VAEDIHASLRAEGVQFVRILWCDNANVIRAKAAHIGCSGGWIENGVGVTAACQAMPATVDSPVLETGLGPVGEVRLVPDWETFRLLPWAPGHGAVLGDLQQSGQPWPYCPRDFLRRQVTELERRGLTVKAAFENEFYLLNPDGTPSDRSLFAQATSLDRQRAVIDDLTEALLRQDIPVEQWYAESGPGQHELSVLYTHPMKAADQQVLFRQTVHAMALRHGLRASFLPKIFSDAAGSGCHLHLSLWRGGKNVTAEEQARPFMAGVLHHLSGLMALTTPSPNSYRRLVPHCWSGAFACWGTDNREAALRVPSGPDGGDPTNFELKTCDASANPYLALGGLLAAGLDGLDENRQLPDPVPIDPGVYTEQERVARGIRRLPTNLGEALDGLAGAEPLLRALGPELARAVQGVRRAEWETLKGYSLDQEVALLLERY